MNGRTVLIIVLVIVAVLVLAPLLWMAWMMAWGGTMGGMMGPGGPGGMMGPFGGMPGLGWLMLGSWLLVLVGTILLVVWVVRRASGGSANSRASQEPARDAALSILQRRYAGGEISREEYERIREDLLRDSERP